MTNEIEATEVTERDNLSVVYRVERLEPIAGKDLIELVHLKDCGYTAVCQKGHQVGDLVVFTKYDTIVPDNELFGFMKESKFRVKAKAFTIKNEYDTVIGKIYSQGIVLPVQTVIDFLNTQDFITKDGENPNCKICGFLEGADITDYLQVKKYIPPVSGPGMGNMQSKGDFPTHLLSKTDEMNLASKMRVLERLHGLDVYITLKIEGSSLSVVPVDGEIQVCSRNNILVDVPTNKFIQAVDRYNLREKIKDWVAAGIQAECFGPGIQKNKLGVEAVDMAVFNVIDILTGDRRPYGLNDMIGICKELEIPMVPVIAIIENFDWTFDQLQEFADVQKYANGELAEGIVIRPVDATWSNVLGGWLSAKVINRDYKL
jgi:RNA ligase (TIGR02306 family)